MIYVVERDKKIYISEKPRGDIEKEEGLSKLLYTLDWDLGKLRSYLRPWINLGDNVESYRLGSLEWIYENRDTYSELGMEALTPCTPEYVNLVSEYNKTLLRYGILENLVEFPEDILPHLSYTCDVWNYLDSRYGRRDISLLRDYSMLAVESMKTLDLVYNEPGRDKKLDILLGLGDNVLQEIYQFLPSILKSQVLYGGQARKESILSPESARCDKLGGDVVDNPWKYVEAEIYTRFKSFERYTGQEIKDTMTRIYEECGVDSGKLRIQDLGDYFEMSFFSYSGKGQYRLGRKLK